MTVGTKTVLFGIHNPLIHGYFVLKAWLICYRKRPNYNELIAIFFHDIGYWNKPNLDGKEGKQHPYFSMRFVSLFKKSIELKKLVLYHSRSFSKLNNHAVSKLALPDKLAMTLYPNWLYLLLGSCSGEITEYKGRMNLTHLTDKEWLIETQQLAMSWVIENANNVEKHNINKSHKNTFFNHYVYYNQNIN